MVCTAVVSTCTAVLPIVDKNRLSLHVVPRRAVLLMRAIELCKAVLPSQSVVEDLLMTPQHTVSSVRVKQALSDAAGPYRDLVVFYNELAALYAHHAKAAKTSGTSTPSNKFKYLDL